MKWGIKGKHAKKVRCSKWEKKKEGENGRGGVENYIVKKKPKKCAGNQRGGAKKNNILRRARLGRRGLQRKPV